jgi:hypothetical protein
VYCLILPSSHDMWGASSMSRERPVGVLDRNFNAAGEPSVAHDLPHSVRPAMSARVFAADLLRTQQKMNPRINCTLPAQRVRVCRRDDPNTEGQAG